MKKATSDYVSKANGKYSWKNTPEEVHQKILGTFATNDIAEQPFGRFSWQLDSYNRITFGNAAASAQARMNGDFDRKELGYDVDGAFIRSTDHEQQSLIVTAIKCAKEERMKESEEMKKQREYKLKKKEEMLKKKILKATDEYTRALLLIESYHLAAGWKSVEDVDREYNMLSSESSKREAVKEQIRMRTDGFGWKKMHHAWSRDGTVYSAEQLKDHLVNTIFPYESTKPIPSVPSVQLPSRQFNCKLGTIAHDTQNYNSSNLEAENKLKNSAEEEIQRLDVNERLQSLIPPNIEDIVGKQIEVKFEMNEVDTEGNPKLIWYKGKVIMVRNDKETAIIQWDDENEEDNGEKLLASKWNRQVKGSWRMDVEEYKILKI